ncbi:MAG: NfeD family protein [Oscillospiraceae bacterium]|nr:NfeD family protein [Oscillospiraceae bacterium]
MSGAIVWILIAAFLIMVEAYTTQLICIWFAVGALFAAFASFAGAPLWLQLTIFIVTSLVVFVVGKPLVQDKIVPKKHATNADRVIGELGVVTEEVNNLKQTGRVDAMGLSWAARNDGDGVISLGAAVDVLRIDGVKLIVCPTKEKYISPDFEEKKEEE